MATSTESDRSTITWRLLLRVIIKATILFVVCNIVFAALMPIETLGSISLYNTLLPGRERLPYGENSAESYNLSLYNIPAMMTSLSLARPKAADEFRVILIGDSATWGWFLPNTDTLAGRLNAGHYLTADVRRVVAYNLGYPIMSLTKDLLLLDAALPYQPDLIVWPVTLESFPREKQLFSPIVQNNATRMRRLIDAYHLNLDRNDPRFVDPDFFGRTIVGQRRELADWFRLQFYGFAWAATGIDQKIPAEIKLRQSDFDTDVTWQTYQQPTALTKDNLAFDVLEAGVQQADAVPILIINEPMFISRGQNSDLRYNSFYPRWAYDQYHDLINQTARANHWQYLDLWNSITPEEFTDTPVHLTPKGSAQLATQISAAILEAAHH